MPFFNNLKDTIKVFGRKMYLAYFAIRYLMVFTLLAFLAYLIFPDRMKDALGFITTTVSAFTSIVLAAIGANWLVSKAHVNDNPSIPIDIPPPNEEEI
jgi:hypothetical protein